MKTYTIFDPNNGNIPFAIALAAALASADQAGSFTTLTASGATVLSTTQVSALTATQIATLNGGLVVAVGAGTILHTTQVGGLTASSISAPVTGTVIVNGATPVSVADTGVTASSSIILTLKTAGGTVSVNPPSVQTITPTTGFTVIANALDTSTYNYLRIG